MNNDMPPSIETILSDTGKLIIETPDGIMELKKKVITKLDEEHKQYLGALVEKPNRFLGHPIRILAGGNNYVSPVVEGFELDGLYQVKYKTEQDDISVRVEF